MKLLEGQGGLVIFIILLVFLLDLIYNITNNILLTIIGGAILIRIYSKRRR